MSKVVDITEKLNFDSNPKIKIKGKEYEVNADAETVLRIMGLFKDTGDIAPSDIQVMYDLVFSEKTRKEIQKLGLQFNDFQVVVNAAVNLIVDNGEDKQGE